jgi:hypothetical protein
LLPRRLTTARFSGIVGNIDGSSDIRTLKPSGLAVSFLSFYDCSIIRKGFGGVVLRRINRPAPHSMVMGGHKDGQCPKKPSCDDAQAIISSQPNACHDKIDSNYLYKRPGADQTLPVLCILMTILLYLSPNQMNWAFIVVFASLFPTPPLIAPVHFRLLSPAMGKSRLHTSAIDSVPLV